MHVAQVVGEQRDAEGEDQQRRQLQQAEIPDAAIRQRRAVRGLFARLCGRRLPRDPTEDDQAQRREDGGEEHHGAQADRLRHLPADGRRGDRGDGGGDGVNQREGACAVAPRRRPGDHGGEGGDGDVAAGEEEEGQREPRGARDRREDDEPADAEEARAEHHDVGGEAVDQQTAGDQQNQPEEPPQAEVEADLRLARPEVLDVEGEEQGIGGERRLHQDHRPEGEAVVPAQADLPAGIARHDASGEWLVVSRESSVLRE